MRISPPYILAYLADSAGCGYHRIALPMLHLLKSGYAYGRCDYSIWPPDKLVNLKPDIIVWQRQHEDYQIENIRQAREALPNAFFCYEIDDILSAVPEWSPHRHHIPYDVDDRMAKALLLCNAVTVSTKTLGRHLKSLVGDNFDVRVSPNLIGRDELTQVDNIRSQNKNFHFKKRIGWGGGISHGGDLDLLAPAMREFQGKVEWVFLGQKPEIDLPAEFHQGVAPQEYLAKLASLDLDLMVAPLVDNHFNRCKSNLRLLEGGACKYPVIASPVEPYLDGSPPVYSYAEPDQWVEKIGQFLADDKPETKANSLRSWVERRYIYEEHLSNLIKYWSPSGTKPFAPKHRNLSTEKVVFVTSEPASVPEGFDSKPRFEDVVDQNCHVIYLRRGTWLTKEQVDYLLKYLVGDVSSVCLLTNDGGFPKTGMFVGVDKEKAETISGICQKLFRDEAIQVPFPYGPVMLLSRRALDKCGFPNITTPELVENAITEWAVMTASRGFQSLLAYGMYTFSAFPPTQTNINALSQTIQARYNVQAPPDPLRDVRTALEIAFYRDSYKDPLPSQNTSYDEWYSIYDTLSPKDAGIVREYNENCNFTAKYYEATAWDKPEADWVLFAHHTTALPGHIVYYFDKAFKDNPDAVFVYADHDFVNGDGNRSNHDFKPLRFDYDLLLGRDYITPVCAVRTKFIGDFLEDGKPVLQASLYEAALTCYDRYGIDGFTHVPRILGHLKEQSKEEQVVFAQAQRKVAKNYLLRQKTKLTLKAHSDCPQYTVVNYSRNVPDPEPSVSIIIPTKNRVEMLSPCVESLLAFTKYSNYEVLIVDNGSTNPKHLEYRQTLEARFPNKVRLLSWPHEYNWSALNNWAYQQAKGEYILFLNDDTRFAHPEEWLSEMVGAAVRPNVGAVGAKLLYSSGLIQHVGVIASKGLCGHINKLKPGQDPGYNGISAISHANTAVTGACLLVNRDKFLEVGGFDERLAHNFNDVHFCLQLNRRGYVNLTVCSAIVQHLEGITRTSPGTPEGQATMREEALLLSKLCPEKDLYWNDNLLFFHLMGGLLVSGLNYDILRWPPEKFDWRKDDWPKERILLIGDEGTIWTEESRAGNICYLAVLNGYQMQFARPVMENVPPFDIRDEDTAVQRMKDLGIDKIILRSILGGTPEVLAFIQALGLPIEYRPSSAESVCPRIDLKQNGSACESGWRDVNTCIECVNTYNSPFGKVNPAVWRDYWRELIQKSSCNLDLIPTDLKLPVLEVHTTQEQYNV